MDENIHINYQKERRVSHKDLFSNFFLIFTFLLFVLGGQYVFHLVNNLQAKKSQLVIENIAYKEASVSDKDEIKKLKEENSKLTQELALLKASGVTNTIKGLELVTAWDTESFSYSITGAFLVEEISDIADFGLTIDPTDKRYLMFSISVLDKRLSGDQKSVPINQYMKLLNGNSNIIPFTSEYLFTKPQVTQTAFVGFLVSKNSDSFTLKTGPIGNEVQNVLNFGGNGATMIQGKFLLREGVIAS